MRGGAALHGRKGGGAMPRGTRAYRVLLWAVLAALLALAAEFFCDRFFMGHWQPGWSLVVLTVCVALAVPLVIVRHVPALREEARRRFHV